ncbi:MAG TPA: zinc ribbon domain-containing protein [Baekduia sp.]|nr:zinc ribbon domain-containing protein [Baekduia sp.]
MITESHSPAPPPVFGHDGLPCPSCGAPLAGDQRYCLSCGARRPEARLEFLDVLDEDVRARRAVPPGAAVATVAPSAPPPAAGLNGRINAHAGLLAVGSLLVLTLLVGLLVGHWATQRDAPSASGSAAAPAPQVITVQGAAAPSATSTDATAGSGSGGSSSSTKGTSRSSTAKDADARDKATAPKGSVSVKSLNSKKAVEDAVKKGKPISTGSGKLPPTDDKAPAGGAGFEDIG